jgi:zinc protease
MSLSAGLPFFTQMKKLLFLSLTALSFAWGASTVHAQFTPDKDVLRATLKNGLRVVIVRNPLAPVVTTVVNYQVGSDETPAGFPGTAHALEHMMFRGNPGLSSDQLAQISAVMGGNFDADTQQTITQYYFTVPADDLELALHIESLRMSGILATEELWDKERGAIEQEVAQDLSNPEYVMYIKLLEAMFKGTPYATDALGTRPSFDKTTGAMLKSFYADWYVPNNAILVIVGDVEPATTLAAVQRLFESIPARRLPRRPTVNLQSVKPATLQMTSDLGYGLAVITFRLPGSDSPEYAAAQVLGDVLASHRGELYELEVEGKALATDFSLEALPKASLAYGTGSFKKGGDGAALIKEMQTVFRQYAKHGVPADLVEAEKRHRLAAEEFEKNSIEGLAMSWSQALALEGRHSPDDDIEAIKKVTVSEVNRVAGKYLNLDRAIVTIMTPEASGKPVSSASFGGHESFASKQAGTVPLPEWATVHLGRLSVPESTIHPVVSTLTNGVQLIVQPESMSGTVSVYGKVRNHADLETPDGQEGVDQVLGQLFDYGSESLDRVAFQKALDDIGATESAGTDFELNVLTNYVDRGVELLAENLLHPGLPEEAFKTVRQQVADTVAGLLESPDYLHKRALMAALFPKNDPVLRQATTSTVSALTLTNTRDYYRHVFRPDLTTIVVIGNVSPERARSVIEKWFGNWTATGPKPETELPPVLANGPSVTAVPDKSRVQDKVVLAETLGLTRSDPDFYALRLGNLVLGGGFYATRLYRDLRKDSGLVYSVGSAFNIGKTRALYDVEFGCDPPNVSKARAIIERNLKDMQTKPVSADELQQAKAQWLREIPLSESSMSDIGATLLAHATHDLPLDETTRAAHRCLALTAEDVQAAFAKWLHPENLVQASQGPEPK